MDLKVETGELHLFKCLHGNYWEKAEQVYAIGLEYLKNGGDEKEVARQQALVAAEAQEIDDNIEAAEQEAQKALARARSLKSKKEDILSSVGLNDQKPARKDGVTSKKGDE